jgi:hypothetical protein
VHCRIADKHLKPIVEEGTIVRPHRNGVSSRNGASVEDVA